METTTEASPSNRELTPTEIKIAIAQIEDRLMRLAKAQSELTKFYYDDATRYESSGEKIKELRKKYEIPDGVFIFEAASGGSAFTTDCKADIKSYLASWVRGRLTKDQCQDIYWYFEEIREADWGWIMLERPLGYYDAPSDDDQDAIRLEMESIGTRSRAKNLKLTKLFSFR
jgi:hypothetical protein